LSQVEDRHQHQHQRERGKCVTPPRRCDLAQTLQRKRRRCMKQREDKIERQRRIKMLAREILAGPRSKKDERYKSCERFDDNKFGVEQRESEQAKIDKKNIAEQKRRSLPECLEREQVKR